MVLLHGKPMQGVAVTRSYSELDKKKSETITTDSEGKFHFDKWVFDLLFNSVQTMAERAYNMVK